MLPIDGYGYRATVVGWLRPVARHRYHGMTGHAGDRACRMPERHMPAERRVIMAEHHEVRLRRQPGQQ
jgi:hypothetical protein